MKFCTLIVAAAAALAALGSFTPSANAQEKPYCQSVGGFGNFDSCGFSSFEQCQATVMGGGGHCRPNPAYVGPLATAPDAAASPRSRSRQRGIY